MLSVGSEWGDSDLDMEYFNYKTPNGYNGGKKNE